MPEEHVSLGARALESTMNLTAYLAIDPWLIVLILVLASGVIAMSNRLLLRTSWRRVSIVDPSYLRLRYRVVRSVSWTSGMRCSVRP